MAVLYKSFQSVLEDKNHKKMFHPRVIYTANISTSQIAKEIAAYSSLSPGDVKNKMCIRDRYNFALNAVDICWLILIA